MNLVLGCVTDSKESIMTTLVVEANNSHRLLGIFEKAQSASYWVTGRVTLVKLLTPLFTSGGLWFVKQQIFLHRLKNTTLHFPFFERGSVGGCNTNDKVSGIFLCPHITFFLMWTLHHLVNFETQDDFNFFLIYIVYHIYQPLRSGRIWHKVNF